MISDNQKFLILGTISADGQAKLVHNLACLSKCGYLSRVRRMRLQNANHADLKRFFLIPRMLILESRVWRGIPSLAAAPDGPAIRPPVSASAASIISLSRSASSRKSPLSTILDLGDSGGRFFFSEPSSTEKVF